MTEAGARDREKAIAEMAYEFDAAIPEDSLLGRRVRALLCGREKPQPLDPRVERRRHALLAVLHHGELVR